MSSWAVICLLNCIYVLMWVSRTCISCQYCLCPFSVLFDTRKGSYPTEVTPVEWSHKDPIHKVIFPSSKQGTNWITNVHVQEDKWVKAEGVGVEGAHTNSCIWNIFHARCATIYRTLMALHRSHPPGSEGWLTDLCFCRLCTKHGIKRLCTMPVHTYRCVNYYARSKKTTYNICIYKYLCPYL